MINLKDSRTAKRRLAAEPSSTCLLDNKRPSRECSEIVSVATAVTASVAHIPTITPVTVISFITSRGLHLFSAIRVYEKMPSKSAKLSIPLRDMVVTTIVTTEMINEVARQNEVNCYNVLTGFKWIAELVKEKEGKENYIIGGEESFGLMIGDQIRDKDAVSAVALLCEMAAYEKSKGRSLFDKMIELYMQYGFYYEQLISITKKGMNGQQEIAAMMEGFRKQPPTEIAGKKVVTILDYQLQVNTNLLTGVQTNIQLPKSNVLQFVTEDGTKISARPSGTEPKIKFYFSVNAVLPNRELFDEVYADLQNKINNIIAAMQLN